ncbi:hypothetical protein B0A48_18613 [Cryoendolithus antarcticus]|uniref:Prion-inhibition and propagation HeLo domain-containing protein n=1 Tax=Cryoendolithus antarcticus TaxID=1507870 RepID=A0A1V8S831_9PEZI|nr:hypothetical protein B0A48_18613 [Cryoendolithus antarcticus]
MEPVSLGIGNASLAGLFETAIDGFRYVRVGQEFGTDLQTNCLMLDNAQVRLSRCGEAVGLSVQTAAATSLQNTTVSKEDIDRAEDRLVTNDFRAKKESENEIEINLIMPPGTRTLRERMQKICHQRQRGTSIGKKAKWAIYKKEHFQNLVGNVDTLVRDLVELFPATHPSQSVLCDEEAEEFRDVEALDLLKDIAKAHDAPFADSLAKLTGRSGTTYKTWNNKDNTRVLNQIAGDQTLYGAQTFTL